jgi:hypothetical protein
MWRTSGVRLTGDAWADVAVLEASRDFKAKVCIAKPHGIVRHPIINVGLAVINSHSEVKVVAVTIAIVI